MVLEIEKYGAPPFLITKGEEEEHVLKVPHISSDHPFDKPSKLEILNDNPRVILLEATDIRGTTDGSPPYKKFICYSFAEEKQLMTAYLAYTFNDSVVVGAWDDKKKHLLENIDMEHVDITPDRVPGKVIQKHLERINGKQCVIADLRGKAEKAFFDILWHVQSY